MLRKGDSLYQVLLNRIIADEENDGEGAAGIRFTSDVTSAGYVLADAEETYSISLFQKLWTSGEVRWVKETKHTMITSLGSDFRVSFNMLI